MKGVTRAALLGEPCRLAGKVPAAASWPKEMGRVVLAGAGASPSQAARGCGGPSRVSSVGEVLELVLAAEKSSVCTTASLVFLGLGVPGRSSSPALASGRAEEGSVLLRMWGMSSSRILRQVPFITTTGGFAGCPPGTASVCCRRAEASERAERTEEGLPVLRATLMLGEDEYLLKGSGAGMLVFTGSRDGLSELVLRGGLTPAGTLPPGWALETRGRGLGAAGLAALSSSQREEQRKTAGRAARLRWGEARRGSEAAGCGGESSARCRSSRLEDSLMKVSWRKKPERSESLPLERADDIRTRLSRLPPGPPGPPLPRALPPSARSSSTGMAPRPGSTFLLGFCMKGMRTGDFCVLDCLGAGDLGAGALAGGPGREDEPPALPVAGLPCLASWEGDGSFLGACWEGVEVREEPEEGGPLPMRAGGVVLLLGSARSPVSGGLPSRCRLRERCWLRERFLAGGASGFATGLFFGVARGLGPSLARLGM